MEFSFYKNPKGRIIAPDGTVIPGTEMLARANAVTNALRARTVQSVRLRDPPGHIATDSATNEQRHKAPLRKSMHHTRTLPAETVLMAREGHSRSTCYNVTATAYTHDIHSSTSLRHRVRLGQSSETGLVSAQAALVFPVFMPRRCPDLNQPHLDASTGEAGTFRSIIPSGGDRGLRLPQGKVRRVLLYGLAELLLRFVAERAGLSQFPAQRCR